MILDADDGVLISSPWRCTGVAAQFVFCTTCFYIFFTISFLIFLGICIYLYLAKSKYLLALLPLLALSSHQFEEYVLSPLLFGDYYHFLNWAYRNGMDISPMALDE